MKQPSLETCELRLALKIDFLQDNISISITRKVNVNSTLTERVNTLLPFVQGIYIHWIVCLSY